MKRQDNRFTYVGIEDLLEELAGPSEGDSPSDAGLLRSMPGLGSLVCATLLAEAWEPIEN